MKLRIPCGISLAAISIIMLSSAVAVHGSDCLDPAIPPLSPTPAGSAVAGHKPYDPFEYQQTLPSYSGEPTFPEPRLEATLMKPTGVDLDVTYISRSPMYNRYVVWYTQDGTPYLRPGTEDEQRWPQHGEMVTFTAHVMNKGTVASGSFNLRWLVDGTEVSSSAHPSLAPGEEAEETYQWSWAHTVVSECLQGEHTVAFEVDPENNVSETYESNNALEDRTDALSLVLAVTPGLYEALETPVDPKWPFSAEDWLQKQIAAMNAAFVRSVYPSALNGVEERVRLDKILVTSSNPPTDWSEDGGFFMTGDDRYGNAYYDPSTDVSGALIHELTHQLGIIDIYNLDVPLEVPQVLDPRGRPVQMELSACSLLPGLMGNPGIRPPIYDEHTALALNANKGYRRGYYGEYLYDVPQQTYLRVLDNQGNPADGVKIALHQRASSPSIRGSRFGAIDNVPEISVTTDENGLALLPNRSVGTPVSTRTGHHLTDNPLGIINVVGKNDEFLVGIARGTHQEYQWLDVTQFNLAAWRGETTLELVSHVPPDNAPDSPAALTGAQEYGEVRLHWQPSSSPTVSAYNVYRTDGPDYAYKQVVTHTTALSYDDPYDYGARAAGYAVTAVDESGRESGFSDLFWALRLWNPADIIVTESNERVILDPQNGYALLIQSPDGAYLDTLGSYDLHLENSHYIARDSAGYLIISHPGDWYSARHSVRVADRDANLLFEFGERGDGPGQFETPTGVATWGEPCSTEGPWVSDSRTLLILHLDGTYAGEQGESGVPSGATFSTGRYGQGALIDAADTLTYASAENLEREQGAIEFWISPQWDGDDQQSYTFFEVGNGWFNRMRVMKDGANNLRFMMWDSTTEYGVAYNVAHWKAGEWHHVAATWDGNNIALYVDGEQRGSESDANPPDTLADTIYVGSSSWSDQQANAVMDELRISDVPRVGNSDACSYHILVADSGNGRVQAFDANGSFVSAFGTPGDGPGEYSDPQGLVVLHNDVVVVVDSGNDRLQVLEFDGNTFSFLREITAGFDSPTDVAAYGSDRIIVADTGNDKVKVLDTEGNLLREFGAPNNGFTGPFYQPTGVTTDRSARIVVADTGNRRVVTILDALPVRRPSSVTVTGPTRGTMEVDQLFTATVKSVTATVPLSYTWQATGQEPILHTNRLSDTASFSWATSGVNVVSVTVRNDGGAVTDTHIITVSEPIEADFIASTTSGMAPLTVGFTNLSSGDYDTCAWTFGDGDTSSDCTEPSHIFDTGIYTVALTVSGPAGTDTLTRTNYITVYETVRAEFTASPTEGIAPLTVDFTNESTGEYTDSLWDFGDGLTSTLESPTHVYRHEGSFAVTLTVSGLGGTDSRTVPDFVTIATETHIYLPYVLRRHTMSALTVRTDARPRPRFPAIDSQSRHPAITSAHLPR
jgi:PKD repeat protein